VRSRASFLWASAQAGWALACVRAATSIPRAGPSTPSWFKPLPCGIGKRSDQLAAAFGINLTLFAAEVAGGICAGSLALLAEAGHMLLDTALVGLSLVTIHFARRAPLPRRDRSATTDWRS
jgi:hypothetical protein